MKKLILIPAMAVILAMSLGAQLPAPKMERGKIKLTLELFTPQGEMEIEQPEEVTILPGGSCVSYVKGNDRGIFCGTFLMKIKGKLSPTMPMQEGE